MSFDEDRRKEIDVIFDNENISDEYKKRIILESEKEILKEAEKYTSPHLREKFIAKYDLYPSWREELVGKFVRAEHKYIDGKSESYCEENADIVEDELKKFASEIRAKIISIEGIKAELLFEVLLGLTNKLLRNKGIK